MVQSMSAQSVTRQPVPASGASPSRPAPAAPLRLTVVSPADNAQFELPAVSPDTTAREIVDQFIRQGLLPPPDAGRTHVLSIRGQHMLDPDESLGAAGVPSGATLQIFSDARGAA